MESSKSLNLVPGARAWLACAVSTAVLLAICYGILLWSDEWRRNSTFDSLVESIDGRDYMRAQSLLKLLTEPPPSISWINRFTIFGAPQLSSKRRETAQKLLELIVSISDADNLELMKAVSTYEDEIFPWLSAQLKTESKPTSLLRVSVLLHDQFQALRVKLQDLKMARTESATLASERHGLSGQYVLVLGECRELFSMKAQEFDRENVQYRFYQSGILQDLPIVDPLPDNIADLAGLKMHLEQIGGAVSLPEGVNPREAFAERLSKLKEAAAPVLIQSQRNRARQDEMDALTAKLTGEIDQFRSQAASNLQSLLLFETRP
jgi:hypothetical protein